jgi:hypothetical protein
MASWKENLNQVGFAHSIPNLPMLTKFTARLFISDGPLGKVNNGKYSISRYIPFQVSANEVYIGTYYAFHNAICSFNPAEDIFSSRVRRHP